MSEDGYTDNCLRPVQVDEAIFERSENPVLNILRNSVLKIIISNWKKGGKNFRKNIFNCLQYWVKLRASKMKSI